MVNIPKNVRCVGSLSVGGNRNGGTRSGPIRHEINSTVQRNIYVQYRTKNLYWVIYVGWTILFVLQPSFCQSFTNKINYGRKFQILFEYSKEFDLEILIVIVDVICSGPGGFLGHTHSHSHSHSCSQSYYSWHDTAAQRHSAPMGPVQLLKSQNQSPLHICQ